MRLGHQARRFGSWLGILLALMAASVSLASEPVWTASQRDHWSFRPPRRPEVPAVQHRDRVRNPIDAFILNGLEEAGLEPAPEADRVTLIRRLRFDLTGLPPTPAEVDAFVNDPHPDAYERLVDRLLDTPQYGERWARPWPDLARFAESDGFKSDNPRPSAWRYRDWVIAALNADLPYDGFVRLQLAGDELAPDDPDAFVATGFNRNWPYEDNNKVPGLNRQLMLDDMTDTTGSVFLGLTIGCARCHDHKYDPISQKDYYRFQAVFAAAAPRDDYPLAPPDEVALQATVAAEHQARVAALRTALEAVEKPVRDRLLREKQAQLPAELRTALAIDPVARSAFQEELLRINASKMKVEPKAVLAAMTEPVRRAWLERNEAMQALQKQAPAPLSTATGMTDAGPQAPPVHLLIKGNLNNPGAEVRPGFPSVLSDPGTFLPEPGGAGTTGRRRALADWLTRPDHPLTARVMVNRLWQHHFGRGIVATPSDFGMQGAEPSHPELLDWLATEFVARGWSQKAMHRLMVTSATYRQSSTPPARTFTDDPDNALVGRMPRRRLEAEAVRDALLAVAGQLDPRVGGPSVFPDLPPGVQTRGGWTRSASAADRNRRSIYVFAKRNLKLPLFDAFDAPDSNVTCPERNVSVNAPQALMLLNSEWVLDQARAFADRVAREVPNPVDSRPRIVRAYRLALGRDPDATELDRAAAFLRDGGDLADLCHALVNLNEFVFID